MLPPEQIRDTEVAQEFKVWSETEGSSGRESDAKEAHFSHSHFVI